MNGKRAKRGVLLLALLAIPAVATAQSPPTAAAVRAVSLGFEDQFERKARTADLRGAVVLLVYGDRRGTDACRALGEQLHVAFHPAAKGMPPAKAKQAAVAPLPNGQAGPDVCVVPVACCGKVPGPVRGLIRGQIAKGSPDVVVWLDFANTMKDAFDLKAGEANVLVLDARGQPRQILNGTPSGEMMTQLLQTVQALRAEAAGKP